MFGLFRGPQGGLERRVLSFAAETGSERGIHKDMMELRVYRAKGRRRMPIELEEFEAGANGVSKARDLKGAGMRYDFLLLHLYQQHLASNTDPNTSLINGGYLQYSDPQRYYQYALIDELANPYATFRYYYRTWGKPPCPVLLCFIAHVSYRRARTPWSNIRPTFAAVID